MANLFKNRLFKQPIIVLVSAMLLSFTASELYCQDSLDSEIAKALQKVLKCEKVEIKTKPGDSKSGKLKSLSAKFVSISKDVMPADYVTVQYSDPKIDFRALRNSHKFKVASYSDFKIGMLVSEQSLKNEFDRRAKKLNFHYNKILIKFTPPYIEVQFDFPASAIPPKDRKIFEKFIRNKRFEGYAALRLEVHDNKVIAIPDKVILNHFLLPASVVAEVKKRMSTIYRIPRIQPFDYALGKVEVLKQYIYFSN
jgi:hypothetical protein